MNKYNLKDRVAIVTGGTKGIGKEIVMDLLKSGAKVALISRNEKSFKKVSQEFDNLGEVIFFPADVKKNEEIHSAVEKIINNWTKIDILINNAGVTNDQLLIKMKEEAWNEVIDINLKGTFNCMKCVIPYMLKNKSGKIINITSIVGITGNAGQTNYCASKAGIIGLTKSAAKEYGRKQITINAIAPGLIETNMIQNIDSEKFSNNILLNRKGTPKDISSLVCFLCSEDASYITGQVINVDGGLII